MENAPARRQAKDEPKSATSFTSSGLKAGPEKPDFRKKSSANQPALDTHDRELRSFKRIICIRKMTFSKLSSVLESLSTDETKSIHFEEEVKETISISETSSFTDMDEIFWYNNGRRYCGEYYMPNDEDEQTRMQMLDMAFLHIFGGRVTTVPLKNPTRILDIGTGCGEWAVNIGDEYPGAQVIGIDIARIQPSAAPLNVYFVIDDAEREDGWTFGPDKFDLIHFRAMVGAFRDWNHIYKETYKHLKPGGWIEVIDFDDYEGIRQALPLGSPIASWLAAISEGYRKSGRQRGIQHLQQEQLTELGFINVSTQEYSVPIGVWPENEEAKEIGRLLMAAHLCGIEALCLGVLTQHMGWSVEDVEIVSNIIFSEVKTLLMDSEKAKGLCFTVRVVKGMKPAAAEQDNGREGMPVM